MKSILTSVLCMISSMYVMSQSTPTYSSENNVLKIEYIGFRSSPGEHVFRVINLLNCPVTATLSKSGGPNENIALTNFDTVEHTISAASAGQSVCFRVKRNGGASCLVNPNSGWIELCSVPNVILPIRFMSVSARRLDSRRVEVTFTCEESGYVDRYHVRLSFDGKTYRTIAVVNRQSTTEGIKTYKSIVIIPQNKF